MDVKTIMVIGAGQMGSGIAQVCAMAGYDVFLHDISQQQLDKGLANIEKLLSRQVEKGKLTEEEKEATLSRLTPSTDLQNAAKADLVIEAVVENMDVKTKLF
ncbi:3-hydroxybutyryl-CoA dehydrogenase, partial [Parageobacillus sp. SY1]